MFEKLRLFFSLFRQGEEVADPKFWKDKQNAANKLTAIFGTAIVLAKVFGVEVQLSGEEIAGLGLFVAGAGNWVLTTITSKKVGLPPKQPADPVPVDQPAAACEPVQQPVRQADPTKDTYFG